MSTSREHADPYLEWDAAFALGALDPADAAAFGRHLATCSDCRTRVAVAQDTLDLLGADRSVPDSLAADPFGTVPAPQTLLPGLLARARRERGRRRVLVGSLAALAAACLVALVVAIWPSGSAGPAPAPAQRMVALVETPVEATASLQSKPWGTEVDVHCRYATAPPHPVPYDLRVVDSAGATHDLGSWTIVPGRTVSFVGGTEVRRERIARVQITLPDGTPVLQLDH